MSEKEKRKHGKQKQAPLWLYSISIFILLITVPFPLVHILDAYPHVDVYQSLAILAIRGLAILFICILIIGVIIANGTKHKSFLMVATLAFSCLTLSGAGLALVYLGFVIIPIAFIILIVYVFVLVNIRFKRRIYLPESLTLIGISTIFAINLIMTSWYMMLPYDVISSEAIGANSYHLILNSGFLVDPTLIELHKCNHLEIFCETIYSSSSDPYYNYYDNDIHWQISSTDITIFVDDEAIHTEAIKQGS